MGNSLYKQVKRVSMGFYFSKEISDLVLTYSDKKFSLVRVGSKIGFKEIY